jgi:hypothetical protein
MLMAICLAFRAFVVPPLVAPATAQEGAMAELLLLSVPGARGDDAPAAPSAHRRRPTIHAGTSRGCSQANQVSTAICPPGSSQYADGTGKKQERQGDGPTGQVPAGSSEAGREVTLPSQEW